MPEYVITRLRCISVEYIVFDIPSNELSVPSLSVNLFFTF